MPLWKKNVSVESYVREQFNANRCQFGDLNARTDHEHIRNPNKHLH